MELSKAYLKKRLKQLLFKSIPQPDYANHPAYGRLFPAPTPEQTHEAYQYLKPFLQESKKSFEKWQKQVKRFEALAPKLEDAASTRHPREWRTFQKDGAVGLRVPPADKQAILEATEPYCRKLNEGRQGKAQRVFQDNSLAIDSPEFRALIQSMLERNGFLALASAAMRMPLEVRQVALLIFDRNDTSYWKKSYSDISLPASAETSYMHIDSDFGTIKFLHYLNEVTLQNGPFCYVLGSHRYRRDGEELIIRKAMDKSRLDSLVLARRQMFWNLPAKFQKKAAFGYDLPEGSRQAAALRKSEKHFTSADGDLILFDYNGVHRGGMVESGERRLLQIQLVPISNA